MALKVRIGIGLGSAPAGDVRSWFDDVLTRSEALGIDSVWLPQRLGHPTLSPIVGLAYAAARTTRLKLGTGIVVLPGTNPATMAEHLATLAALAPRRILPVFGLRPADDVEVGAFPVSGNRGRAFDDALVAVRRLLEERDVDLDLAGISVRGLTIEPHPQRALDLWLGGRAPGALERVGRLADGWLGSLVSPREAGRARAAIEQAATDAGRVVDPDHFGLSLPLAQSVEEIPPGYLRGRPDVLDVVPVGWAALQPLLQAYVEQGISKFVVRPVGSDGPDAQWLERFAEVALPLQN